MKPILSVRDLHVTFKRKGEYYYAVRGVSFDLYPGEILGIVGESASGKTVTMKALLQLLLARHKNIEGKAFYQHLDLLQASEKMMRSIRGKEISMVFQDPMTALDPTMRVGKQIIEALLSSKKISYTQAKKQTLELLEELEIDKPKLRFAQYPFELSGGICQRITIAMSLIAKPKILIADEPTTAVDIHTQKEIIDLLKKMQRKYNLSIIFITHDIPLISGIADRIAVMYAGEIIEMGNTEALTTFPFHPYTQKLLTSIPRLDQETPLSPIPGTPPDPRAQFTGCPFYSRCDQADHKCNIQKPYASQGSLNQWAKCWRQIELEEQKKEDLTTSTPS